MKRFLVIILFSCWYGHSSSQINHKYQLNESLTYEEAIQSFKDLADSYASIQLIETEFKTDVGRNLHVAVFNHDKEFDPQKIDRGNKPVLFINNAIHPGESCGVDASVKLFERLGKYHQLYPNVVVVAIPVYNIGGMLNRSPYKRSGQNGPSECGFRGNYQHLDLNRDFTKCDALNTEGFVQIFHQWKPNLFVDTHTTNGSDHQYTLTLITSQLDKMNPVLKDYVAGKMEPLIYRKMKEKGKEIIPYVYSIKGEPTNGIKDFMETPRYSSGYTNLFNCVSFISEAHKYKTFTQRVEHTYSLLEFLCEYSTKNNQDLITLKQKADEYSNEQGSFDLNWALDTTTFQSIKFKGFELEEQMSEVTKQSKRFYNREKPFEVEIPYYRSYQATENVVCPDFYILPQCYRKVAYLLQLNGVELISLENDSLFSGEMYMVTGIGSPKKPYEKHFLHKKVQVQIEKHTWQYYKGDWLIKTNQANKRFIVEVLEPHSADSYLRWNYFDNVFQQKEWFSDFAFDPIAKELLEDNPTLKQEFELKQQTDTTFANNHFAQLFWIFKRSPYYEKEHNLYPVMRYSL